MVRTKWLRRPFRTKAVSGSSHRDLSKDPTHKGASSRRLRVASYNIQTGVATGQYRHYLTQSWHHFLPNPKRLENLGRMARVLSGFDLVGLQEVDAGSLRSGFVDQTEYLAQRAGFGYWYQQTNRNFGRLAKHSNALMSRICPTQIEDHKLPGLPGRGAMIVRFGVPGSELHVCVMHLALGRRTRTRQISYMAELLAQYPNVIVLGDLNCAPDSAEMKILLSRAHLRAPVGELNTFPSWRPQRMLDHILVSGSLEVEEVSVLNYPLSDHLPLAMTLLLPHQCALAA